VSSDVLTDLEPADRARVEALLVEFDLNWAPDRLAVAIDQLPADGPIRRAALHEMVKIDLERNGRVGRLVMLADYVQKFPELLDSGTVPSDLARAEAAAQETLPPSSPSTGSVHLPKEFGRYRIVRPLGRGGMGGVYLARDTELDRTIALKVPRFPPSDTAGFERFQREARAAGTIDHPNVCRLYDVSKFEGLPYLTMAYIEGPTLAEVLRDGPLPPRRAVELTVGVARGIAAAHAQGVVHRDLKPSNILIAADGAPVVTDFGLATRDGPDEAQLTTEGTVLGTPLYMSPEQVSGERAGPASDVYSLGIVLYELLTGRPPFTGSRANIFAQVLTKDPAHPSSVRPGLDPRLDAIIRRALTKKPADRFPTMAAFAAALEGWLKARTRRVWFASRSATRAWLAGLGLLLVVGTAALIGRQRGESPNDSPAPPFTERATTTFATTASPISTVTTGPTTADTAKGTAGPRTTTGTGAPILPGLRFPPVTQPQKPKALAQYPLRETDQRIIAVTFSDDGRNVLAGVRVGDSQATVRRWDTATANEEPVPAKVLVRDWLTFQPDGRRYLAGGGMNLTSLLRVTAADPIAEYKTGPHALAGAVSRDGKRVIVGGHETLGPPFARVWEVESGEARGAYPAHKEPVRCVALSEDGKWAFSASADRFAAWAVDDDKRSLIEAGKNTIRHAAFIPGPGRIVVGTETGAVSVYDVTGTFKVELLPGSPRDAVTALAVSADGRLVAAAGANKTFRVWELPSRRVVTRLADLAEPMVAVAFSPDGKRILTAGARSWCVWELPD